MVNIFCPFRRKYVAATPEENVRQAQEWTNVAMQWFIRAACSR